MNIIDRLKKWFFNEEKVGIINIGDIVKIPGRDYYKNDLSKLNQIDIYKEEYLNILSKRKLISSKEISFDNLEKEFLMYIELILNLYLNKEQFINVTPEAYIKELINMFKLQLYLNEINNMETETIEKLIALEELQKGKRVPIVNRSLLNEKINNLKMIVLSFRNQRVAISIEIKNQLTLLNNNDMSCHIDHVHIVDKYQQIYDLAENIISTSMLNSINNLKIDYMPKIALIEKELEIYCYMHKEEITNIKYELDELNQMSKDENNKQTILNKLIIIGDILTIFDTYGRNIATKDIWYIFYKVKFDTLTCNLLSLKGIPFNTAFHHREKEYKHETEYYKQIIMDKITNIVMGKNHNLDKIFKQDTEEAIRLISISLKDDRNKFNPFDILYDKYKLAILLSLDTEIGLSNFYKNYYIKSPLNKSILALTMRLSDELPIETIYKMRIAPNHYQYFPRMHDDELYYLYKLLEKHTTLGDYYYLPEGIIDIYKSNFESFKKTFAYCNINYEANNRIVIMPKTLKTMKSNIFLDAKIKGIVLNDGLEEIWNDAIYLKGVKYIALPASLSYTTSMRIHKDLKAIKFIDYKNSNILNDDEELSKFINAIYNVYCFETEKGDIVGKHKFELEDNLSVYRECSSVEIYTGINYIFFEENGKIAGEIHDLPILFKKRYGSNKTSAYLHDEEIAEIINELKDKIKKSTGYDLVFKEKKQKNRRRSYGFHDYFKKH